MKSLLTLLAVLFCASAFAQVFPVHVTPQIAPPYSPYLSDYTAPGAQHFSVQIRANDVTLAGYPCRLRLTIEGVGITIRTRADYRPAPIMLEGSITQVLYGYDLHAYFHPDALDFSGITKSEYTKTARLPEGVYRFSIEVLDYNRGTVVSNNGMTMVWIVLNDPPMLNLPSNASKVDIRDPVNILFSWTPRHSASPNAAFSTEYIFRMVELWPEDRNPNDAFLTQSPLYETTTSQNQILYGVNETPLTPGRKYAWQVQARDTDGKDLYRNGGRSEVFVFQYGEALATPQDLHMRWAKPTTLAIQWSRVKVTNEEVKYRLQWRPRRRSEARPWYETRTKFTEKTLYHLEPNTEYEMQVRTETPLRESPYSEIQIFKTLPPENDAFVCKDDVAPPPVPANIEPVFPLSINDTIHAGGYEVLVRDVMPVKGKFFGSGVAIVPWLNGAKVRVSFENIGLNDRFWLTSGSIKTVWNAESKFLFEEQTSMVAGTAPDVGELDLTVVTVDSLITITGGAIASVELNVAGEVVVTTTDGKKETLAKGGSYAIVDAVGNGYVVDQQGNIAKTTATEATAAATRGNRDYDLVFRFTKGDGRFGFDEKQYEALAHYYQLLEDGSHAAWKALSSAGSDPIQGELFSTAIKSDAITFEANGGTVTPSSRDGNKITLNLHGSAGGLEVELLALYSGSDTVPPKVLGKLNLATYNPVRYHLQIVPVNDAVIPGGIDVAEISRRLNLIYNSAVVEWDVNITANPLNVPLDETFDEGERGLLSNYTGDMKKVLNAFGRFQNNTYYIFLVETPRNESALGYMPRNRQAGFVFTGPHRGDAEEFVKTIAHELGHGAFNLKHTFSEYNLPAGMTDNVMDYSNGTALYKYQWDHIHDPQAVMGLFEGGEEVEYKTQFAFFEQEFLKTFGERSKDSPCWDQGVQRGFEVSKRLDIHLSLYAGFLRLLLCETKKERCEKNAAVTPFVCGLSNGLLQELDWLTLIESIEEWSIDPREILNCMIEKYPIGETLDDNVTFANVAFECMAGIELKDLTNGIKEFVVANWDDPYYQGQATAFALSLLSPFKAKVLSKLQQIPQYSEKIAHLKLLANAIDSDELIGISKTLTKVPDAKQNSLASLELAEDFFSSARKNAVGRFGKDAEDLIYVKFKQDGGAAAEIIDHYGETGLAALKKVKNIQEAAAELVKNKTVFRYVNEGSYNFKKLKSEGIIESSPASYPIYISLDRIEHGFEAKSKLQLPGDVNPTWVVEFSGNQIINDVKFPKAKWTKADYLEVRCRSYPKKGEWGGGQFITHSEIRVEKLRNLETGEVLTFTH